MLIEQSTQDLAASRVVGANVTLRDVRLAYCRTQSERSFVLHGRNSEPQITRATRTHLRHEENLILPIELTLSVQDVESEDVVIRIDCTFEADYTVKAGFEPTTEQIRSFHEANVVFNCWPFFRELVHSLCMRMGHPPIAVPLLRMGLKPNPPSDGVPTAPSTSP